MKKSILFLAASVMAMGIASAQIVDYKNAEDFPVYGKVSNKTSGRYTRFPLRLKGTLSNTFWRLSENSAGLYVRFRSDAPAISLRWQPLQDNVLANMAPVAVKGMDLYAMTDGKWRYVKSAVPWKANENGGYTVTVIDNMDPVMREYMLYLPLYDGLASLEIGVPRGFKLEKPSSQRPVSEKPIVMYGTSILQGASASRPGLSQTAVISRYFDREVINMGFSGSAHLEPEVAEWMAEVTNPGVFVLDYLPNATPEEIQTRGEDFVRKLRAVHPDVPIIFIDDPLFPHSYFDIKMKQEIDDKNAANQKLFQTLKKAGFKKLHYISTKHLIGDDAEGTSDGIHFNDIGTSRYTEILIPYIERAIK